MTTKKPCLPDTKGLTPHELSEPLAAYTGIVHIQARWVPGAEREE